MSDQNWFSGLDNATQGGGGNYPRRGEYVAEILHFQRKLSTNPATLNHRLIVGDMRITEVLAAFPADGGLEASNRVGETVGFFADLNGAYPTLETGKVRGVIEAAVGSLTEAQIDTLLAANGITRPANVGPWDALAAFVTEPPGARLAGTLIRLSVVPVVTKRGKAIAVPRFSAHAPAPVAA